MRAGVAMTVRALVALAGVILPAGPVVAEGGAGMPEAVARAEAELAIRPHAVDEIWRDLSSTGLPQVEAGESDGPARVTFLIRTRDTVEAVHLDSVVNVAAARQPVDDYLEDFTLPLQRIGAAPIWWISLDVPRDTEAVYSFLLLRDGHWQRRSDAANPRHLRGGDAEAVLRLDRAPDMAPIRPWPARLQRQPDVLNVESAALERVVRAQLWRNPDAASDAPVVILYDAFLWGVRAPAWEIAANLAADGRIPPVHVVLVDQLDAASAERRYDDQTRFLADELLPRLRGEGLTAPARQVILAGASRRGLAASRAALQRPDAFGGVIALSGSFYWSPDGEAPEWLIRNLPPAPQHGAPRFLIAAGSLETVVTATNAGHVMLDTNRRFAEALDAAGYPARLEVFPGGHDIAAWRHAFADGLVALLGPDGDE